MFRTLARYNIVYPPKRTSSASLYYSPTLPMSSELTKPGCRKRKTRRSLPATLMRAGTSKGLFIHRHHLPASESLWSGSLLAAMGSQDSDARQIDGVGGATSTTSKVAVISPSARPGIDVDYTFVQVAVGHGSVDFSGNCGNMCAGVGLFAAQEGLVRPQFGARSLDVRIFNTNTARVIVDTVEVDPYGTVSEDGDYTIPGVKGTGSEIKVAFVDPAGSMTGQLFPTGQRQDKITVQERDGTRFSVGATLIDAANPFVFVDASTLPSYLRTCKRDSAGYLEHMESIRRAGAVLMGLASSIEAAAKVRGTPKLALLSAAPNDPTQKHDVGSLAIQVIAFSMGKPHPSLQLTGAACLASAVCIDGTVAHSISSLGDSSTKLGAAKHSATALAQHLTLSARSASPLSDASSPPTSASSDADEESFGMSASSTPPSELLQSVPRTVRITHASGAVEVDVVAACSDDWAVVDRCSSANKYKTKHNSSLALIEDSLQYFSCCVIIIFGLSARQRYRKNPVEFPPHQDGVQQAGVDYTTDVCKFTRNSESSGLRELRENGPSKPDTFTDRNNARRPISHAFQFPLRASLAPAALCRLHGLRALLCTFYLSARHRHQTARVHLAKALNLLGQAGVAPARPRDLSFPQDLALKLPVEHVDELLPTSVRLAVFQVCQDPRSLRGNVWLDDFAEAHTRVSSNLLNSAFVKGGDGGLVGPVTRRRVEKDALALVGVGQLNDEFMLLIEGRSIWKALEATGDKLRADVLLAE
ncbi:hypothetical protein OPT61_g71 [Boeremia exigua]|uniref:Uncharacterized protein n=1 Tax=Boeremia exigua TaxID=749465 RepID=A0ACC2IVH1_9PLEO|nr:hypothetical protein OPT61_g71 [Boeremia exigua]